jgi:hypothetical protein
MGSCGSNDKKHRNKHNQVQGINGENNLNIAKNNVNRNNNLVVNGHRQSKISINFLIIY